MKYEAVFGDQSLFDGAGLFTGIDIVTRSVDDGLYRTSRLSDETSASLKKAPIVAMRRIIADPKRWTVEDQKAGRLPDVGSEVVTTYDTKRYVFVGESCHENQWSLRDAESGKVYHTSITCVLPIETPEEKAQREEDEFVDSESFFIDVCTMSGPMKAVYKQGARAAYRKLKGGE